MARWTRTHTEYCLPFHRFNFDHCGCYATLAAALSEKSKDEVSPNASRSAPDINSIPPSAPEINMIQPLVSMDVDGLAISSSKPSVDNSAS